MVASNDSVAAPAFEHNGGRICFIIYNFIILFLTVIGDTVILLATIRYKAIRLHRVTVVIIQHIAVCDLLLILLKVFPAIVTSIADRWVFGEFLGHLQSFLYPMISGMILLLTCTMSATKLLMLKYPFRSRTWSTRRGHFICFAVWLFQLLVELPLMYAKLHYWKDTLYYDFSYFSSSYDHRSSEIPAGMAMYFGIYLTIFPSVLFLATLIASILILVRAKKAAGRHAESLRWEGISTVLATVVVFYIPYLPMYFMFTFHDVYEKLAISVTYIRIFSSLSIINIPANFFIYCCTVSSFRAFLSTKIRGLLVRQNTRTLSDTASVPPDPVRTANMQCNDQHLTPSRSDSRIS